MNVFKGICAHRELANAADVINSKQVTSKYPADFQLVSLAVSTLIFSVSRLVGYLQSWFYNQLKLRFGSIGECALTVSLVVLVHTMHSSGVQEQCIQYGNAQNAQARVRYLRMNVSLTHGDLEAQAFPRRDNATPPSTKPKATQALVESLSPRTTQPKSTPNNGTMKLI